MRRLFIPPVALLVAATAACGSGQAAGREGQLATSRAEAVEIKTFQFAPKDLRVSPGTKVTWTNSDAILHTVTSGTRDADAQGQPTNVKKDGRFDGQLASKGTTFSFTFAEPGTYSYFCDRHPGMDAVVTVA